MLNNACEARFETYLVKDDGKVPFVGSVKSFYKNKLQFFMFFASQPSKRFKHLSQHDSCGDIANDGAGRAQVFLCCTLDIAQYYCSLGKVRH